MNSQAPLTFHKSSSYAALEKRTPCPSASNASLLEAKTWGSSKGCIFRIKSPLSCVEARVAVCMVTAQWYQLPFFAAGCSKGRLQRRSRCGLEKSAMPSRSADSAKKQLKPCPPSFWQAGLRLRTFFGQGWPIIIDNITEGKKVVRYRFSDNGAGKRMGSGRQDSKQACLFQKVLLKKPVIQK